MMPRSLKELARAVQRRQLVRIERAPIDTVPLDGFALGLSDRQFRRLKAAYRARGNVALAHGNRGKRSPRRLSDSERQQIVQCMFEKYPGLNDCHLTEKLSAEEHLSVSREFVRRLRIEAGEPAGSR